MKRKGFCREAGSEGSVEQRREPMYKNRIRGGRRWTSGRTTVKSISIKGARTYIRRLRVEGGRTYLGRSVLCPSKGLSES